MTLPCCSLSQIGDFGLARDLMDDTYYKSRGGQIPIKWTAPEVSYCYCLPADKLPTCSLDRYGMFNYKVSLVRMLGCL